jgi:putative hemolysin
MKRLVMLAALLAAACQPMPAEGGKTDLAQAAPVAAQTPAASTPANDAAACAARGGKMLPQGRMQTMQCVVSYSDAGQRCTDGDQCQGACRIPDVTNAPRPGAAAVGQCQPTSSSFGCYTTVEDGKAEATICVD